MERTITVKGVGKATVKPDQVELRLSLSAKEKDYEACVALASGQVEDLKKSLMAAGFDEGSLKTADFNIRALHNSKRDRNGEYVSVFDCYECSHQLKLVFDFDTVRLGQALRAVAVSGVNPAIHIDFTVKNPAAVNALILEDAAVNARKKAEILCAASGVTLGELVNIDYNWGEISYLSPMGYACDALLPSGTGMNIIPDDIDAGDTAAFTWRIC